VPTERYFPGQRIKVYVAEVHDTHRGPQIVVSRAHRLMLRRLFEQEVPEIYDGRVEIKAIAREAGARSKVAVIARQQGIDPVGSCVGIRGVRIQNIVNELNGEKIDVVEWHEDPARYVANALSPAQVVRVSVDEDTKTATVVVPERQLSLAIGKEGQNARLAAKLTGWRIDIQSEAAMRAAAERAREAEEPALVEAATPSSGEVRADG
jgi:N utilization substance protein A